jgi:hypothetical protein
VATWVVDPLLSLLVVTTAVRFPAVVGFVEKVTVSAVLVAVVTVPTAPLLRTTVLFAAVVLKPKPLIVNVAALAARFVVLLVITGITVATWTAAPLLTLFVVITAVKLPASDGPVESVTVNEVAVAEVTVPTAPLLNTTVLLAAVVSKPAPAIVKDVALAAKASVSIVATGITLATCTADPLVSEFVVTTAVKEPTAAGVVENVTVSAVALAEVTVPTAPLLNVTVLSLVVVPNPKPLIVTVVALAARSVTLEVITGFTVAT